MTRRGDRLRRWAARERAWRLLIDHRRPQHRVHAVTHRLLDVLAALGNREDERIRRIGIAFDHAAESVPPDPFDDAPEEGPTPR